MGMLSELGQNPAWGAGTAQGLAQRSLGYGALATGLDVGANVAAGVEAYNAASYGSKVLREGAGQVRLAGQIEEGEVKSQFTRLEAQQKVAQAANGIDVDSKSAVAVRDATARIGALDAAMVHYNAAREAYGLDTQAALTKRAGTSAAVRGVAGAGLSFLSGSRALGEKWNAYKQSGAA